MATLDILLGTTRPIGITKSQVAKMQILLLQRLQIAGISLQPSSIGTVGACPKEKLPTIVSSTSALNGQKQKLKVWDGAKELTIE